MLTEITADSKKISATLRPLIPNKTLGAIESNHANGTPAFDSVIY